MGNRVGSNPTVGSRLSQSFTPYDCDSLFCLYRGFKEVEMSDRQGDMSYKGYVCEVKYSEEDGKFIGRVLDIEDAELEFAGSSVSELQDGFRAVVDRYLELKGEDSDVEITVTLKKSLLRALIECTEEQEVTIDEFVSAALFDYCSANYGD